MRARDSKSRPAQPPAIPPRERLFALGIAAAFLVMALCFNGFLHAVPLYGTETDLVGEYIPAARAVAVGILNPANFTTKGPGYPILLALAGPLFANDLFEAAKVINSVAGAVVLWTTFLLFGRFLGWRTALLVVVGVAVNPTFLQATLEAGTDLPALAMALGASSLAISSSTASRLLLAGVLAACAALTRSNYVFLPMAALVWLLREPVARTRAGSYFAGFVTTFAGWFVVHYQATGIWPADTNYLNLARGLYGTTAHWEEFLEGTAHRFNSYWDVLRLDPTFAAARLALTAGTRWFSDASQLFPLPLGLLGVAGMVWSWRRQRAWPDLLGHFALAYLPLCLAFYSPRFSLYLLPFYLSGAVLLLARDLSEPSLAVAKPAGAMRFRRLSPIALAVLFGVSGAIGVQRLNDLLVHAPHDVQEIGSSFRGKCPPGTIIMARKPHVAYYAGTEYSPLPRTRSLTDLIVAARHSKAQFVFVSSIEAALRPEYAVLTDSGLALPGLRQVAYLRAKSGPGSALYVVGEILPTETQQRHAIAQSLARDRGRGGYERELAIAIEYLYAGSYAKAQEHLLAASRMNSRDPDVAALLSNAYHAQGRYEDAARECLRAMTLGEVTGAHYDQLGRIRFKQRRLTEASESFRNAIRLEPAVVERRYLLGLTEFEQRRYAEAATEFQAFLEAVPASTEARRLSALSLARSGDRRSALRLLESAPTESRRDPLLDALADSLRAS